MSPRVRTRLRLVLAALLGAGCGGGSDVTGPPSGKPVATVEITPNPATLTEGQTLQLTAVTKAGDGSPLTGREVTWKTSDAAVAGVDATGTVTGVALGQCTITATSEKVAGTVTVTVVEVSTAPLIREWIGGASAGVSDWSVPANWRPSGVPAELDTARVLTAANPAVLSADVRVAQLVISGGTFRNAGRALTVRQP